MKRIFLYITLILLIIIGIRYYKDALQLLFSTSQIQMNPFSPSNWIVTSIDPSIAQTMHLHKGDALLSVNKQRRVDFYQLDNDLLLNKGKNIQLELLRDGHDMNIEAFVPVDLQSNLSEKRVLLRPVYSGDPNSISQKQSSFFQKAKIIGLIILVTMGTLVIGITILIYLKKKLGWYLGGLFVFLTILSTLKASLNKVQTFMTILYLVALGFSLLLSYEKIEK